MNDSTSSNAVLGLPATVWIALILGVAGVFALSQRPFQDTRPPSTAATQHPHESDDGQNIEARLWEDPLNAIALARRNALNQQLDPYPAESLWSAVEKAEKKHAKILVMAVMVTGEPYADDMETRRRTRYAVLAGLYRSGFIPANSDHVGYLQLRARAASGTVTGEHDVEAFEWLKRDTAEAGSAPAHPSAPGTELTQADQVLLLWLDQDGFRELPIRTLARFLKPIAHEDPKLVDIAVLGPGNSDGLRAMYDEAQRSTGSDPWEAGDLREMDFYSSRATGSDLSITGVSPGEKTNLAKTIYDLTEGKVRLYRAVTDDQTVEKTLFDELKKRGIKSSDRIALVAERDTLYARGMGSYFNGCRNPPRIDPAPPHVDAAAGVSDEGPHVVCFTYLRGLDGLAPYSQPAPSPGTSSQSQNDGGHASANDNQAPGVSDEATGPGQLDYLRRLANDLSELRKPPTRIRAIGVISSDVYDKLLVLQALRNAVPGVTYFTFDLDARLLEQKNLRWTRQLIVGSSLGLSLRPELQGDIPPFRDSYQTSTFYATMLAAHRFVTSGQAHATQTHASHPGNGSVDPGISHYFNPDDSPQAGLQWTDRPRVFEIGRSDAYDLTPGHTDHECEFDGRCRSIAAGRDPGMWSTKGAWSRGLLIGLLLAVLFLAGAALALGVRGVVGLSRTHTIPGLGIRRWSNETASLLIAAAVILVTTLTWPYLVDTITRDGLPAPLFSGANPWIAPMVDAVSIIMVLLLVVRGQRKLHDNAACVGREFKFTMTRMDLIKWHRQQVKARAAAPPAPAAPQGPGVGNRAWVLPRWLIWFWFPLRALPQQQGVALADTKVTQIEALIAQYLHHGTTFARTMRAAPVTAAVVLLLVIPLEKVPGIAHFGRVSDLLSFLSLVAIQFLIFWTADALLLSRSFILALQRDRPAWPTTSDFVGLPVQQGTQWLDLKLVAARTRAVSALVWYPSFVLAFMAVVALTIQFREFQFANNPIALGLGTLFVIGSAVALRTAAESLRRCIRRNIEDDRLRAPNAPLAAQLQLLLDRIDALRQGAFAPYSEQPIVRAVLVPAATYGATVGLQYLHLGN